MKPISHPSDDNPRHAFDEATMRLRLMCTDCEPEAVVSEHDVAHWDVMPAEMQEREGDEFAFSDMADWMEHMRDVHHLVYDHRKTTQ